MRDYIKAFKNGIKLLPGYLWKFLKTLPMFVFIYGISGIIPVMLSLIFMWIFEKSNIPANTFATIAKLIVIIGQIIPASIFAAITNEEKRDEYSMDICLCVCIVVSVFVWKCF